MARREGQERNRALNVMLANHTDGLQRCVPPHADVCLGESQWARVAPRERRTKLLAPATWPEATMGSSLWMARLL